MLNKADPVARRDGARSARPARIVSRRESELAPRRDHIGGRNPPITSAAGLRLGFSATLNVPPGSNEKARLFLHNQPSQ